MIRLPKSCSTKAVFAQRAAFTLLELLLVLLLIVAILAISWPALTRRMGQNDLRESAMELAHALTETRLSAMESGEPWVLRYEPQSGRYLSLPLRDSFENPQSLGPMNGRSFLQNESAIDRGIALESTLSDDSGLVAGGRMADWRLLPHEAKIYSRNRVKAQSQSGLSHNLELVDEEDGFVESPSFESSDSFGSNDLDESLVLTNQHSEWIVFDSLGRTVDCRLLVTLPNSDWEMEVSIRGITGGVSLASPRRRSVEIDSVPNEVSFESEPVAGGMEAWQ